MKFTEGIKIELDPCTCKICTECRIIELLNAHARWKEQCEKLAAALKLVKVTYEFGEDNFPSAMYCYAEQELADHERFLKEQNKEEQNGTD